MLFVPPGDRRKGIEQLTEAAAKGRYARTEAAYFLMQIFYFYEKDYPRSLALALDLNRRYPENMLFHRYLGRSYAALANWSSAGLVFQDIQARVRRGQRGYTANAEREAEYYLGVAAMNAGELDSALQHFFRCDELSRSLDSAEASGFMALANLKAGNIYDLQSRRDLALVQYRKVLGLKEYQDSHGSARQFLLAPYAH